MSILHGEALPRMMGPREKSKAQQHARRSWPKTLHHHPDFKPAKAEVGWTPRPATRERGTTAAVGTCKSIHRRVPFVSHEGSEASVFE